MPTATKRPKQSRLFTASIKPALTPKQMSDFVQKTKGSVSSWVITHDKDISAEGELIEAHTHFLLEYDTPRKISSIANLLGVSENFIEFGDSKNALLRYLTHKDDSEKFQYSASEVYSNHPTSYEELVKGTDLTDRQIAELIRQGKGYDLIGIVNIGKLRAIQSFLQYDRTGQINEQLRSMGEDMHSLKISMGNVETMAINLMNNFSASAGQLRDGLMEIAKQIRVAITTKSNRR
jgi:hypothetical protein